MIYVIAGTYAAYRNLCDKLQINPVNDARFIHPDSERLCGIRIGQDNRLILTCGWNCGRNSRWYSQQVMPRLSPGYVPEEISCCHKQHPDSII